MMSLNACLAALILLLLPTEDLGVKKRVKVLGVTVGPFLVLLLTFSFNVGSGLDDIEFSSGVGCLLVWRLAGGQFSPSLAMTAFYDCYCT